MYPRGEGGGWCLCVVFLVFSFCRKMGQRRGKKGKGAAIWGAWQAKDIPAWRGGMTGVVMGSLLSRRRHRHHPGLERRGALSRPSWPACDTPGRAPISAALFVTAGDPVGPVVAGADEAGRTSVDLDGTASLTPVRGREPVVDIRTHVSDPCTPAPVV